jgi:amino acid transporter
MTVTDHVPGNDADETLQHYGYRPEFRRELKRFASFAIGFSFISITTGIFTTYGGLLTWGGPRGIWSWPFVAIGQLFVALVFAALSSRIPIAGYSYQWISRIANPKFGWLVGWISFMFLTVVIVSVDYAIAQTVLPRLFNYTETPQNAWLVTAIIIAIQMLLIMFSTRWSTRINNAAVGTEVIGIVGLTILLLIVGLVSKQLNPGNLFSTGAVSPNGYFDLGGIFSTGPFMFSFLLGAYTIVGFEAAANLAEETENAHKVVPFAMWSAVALSGIVGFLFLLVLNLASYNVKDLAASATPVADIVTHVLGTVVGDIFLIFVTFSIFACGLVIFMTHTRLTWAMARDNRFPAHTIFKQVNERTGTPLATTLLTGIICEIVLAVFALQANTLTNLFSASTLLPAIIYLITVIFYIYARRKLPEAQEGGFSLGRFEWPVIILALIWLVFELAIFRDGTAFTTPWLYCLIMFAIGLIYFVWLLFARPEVLNTKPILVSEETLASTETTDS